MFDIKILCKPFTENAQYFLEFQVFPGISLKIIPGISRYNPEEKKFFQVFPCIPGARKKLQVFPGFPGAVVTL